MHEDIANLAVKMGVQLYDLPEFMRHVLAFAPDRGGS